MPGEWTPKKERSAGSPPSISDPFRFQEIGIVSGMGNTFVFDQFRRQKGEA